ncbi:MAG: hypothetical protein HKL88_02440 [Bacteroidia bacterium]|nr:hypothetical protein [Bacteroidia bacterium]
MRNAITVLLIIAAAFGACAQNTSADAAKPAAPDTIYFVNGDQIAAYVIDTSGDKITFEKQTSKKHKKIETDMENVFSIRYGSTGKEIMVYNYDTLIGNDYTVADARLFIAGERDAQRGYHCRGLSAAAFAIGVASGITGASLFVLLPPYVFTGIVNHTRVHVRHKSVTQLDNATRDPYLYGYAEVARRKRTLRTLLWGGTGVAIGFVLHFATGLNK